MPNMVVDIHQNFDNPRIIDEFRLHHFFESCGKNLDLDNIKSLLHEMCAEGYLIEQGGGRYLARTK